MACIKNKEYACCESSVEARRCKGGLFLFEILVLLVVVMSHVFQLFTRPSLVLLAIGTIPCALLWKRPLTAFLLACTTVTIYLFSGGSFFRIFAREVSKGLLRGNKRKKPCKGSRHLYAPQITIVDLVGEGLDDAGAEACAEEALGSENISTSANPKMDERVYSPQSNRARRQAMGTRSFNENGAVFSRRGRNKTRNLYRARGDTQRNVDIDHEMEVADNMMEAMLSAFPDT